MNVAVETMIRCILTQVIGFRLIRVRSGSPSVRWRSLQYASEYAQLIIETSRLLLHRQHTATHLDVHTDRVAPVGFLFLPVASVLHLSPYSFGFSQFRHFPGHQGEATLRAGGTESFISAVFGDPSPPTEHSNRKNSDSS